MAKKGRRVRRTDSPLRWYLKQHQRWVRRLGIVTALAAVAGVLWFVVDPLQGPPTALTESGEEVTVGVVGAPGAAARTGAPAPNFVLPDYDQQAIYLDQFQGKIVLVNFWASWCTFCEREMPDIIDVAKRFPDDVVVLAVNRGEPRGTAKGWSDGQNLPELPNVHWLLDRREDVTDAYRVEGMPQSFFIDRAGRVHLELRRVTEYEELLTTLENLLDHEESQAAEG
jgi:thiol-disulfide isomerase/thioredoxin